MGLFLDLQNKFKNSLWLIVVFLVFIYFSFYTVNGERGLLRYMYLSKEIKYARQVAEQYNAEKRELEQKVRLGPVRPRHQLHERHPAVQPVVKHRP